MAQHRRLMGQNRIGSIEISKSLDIEKLLAAKRAPIPSFPPMKINLEGNEKEETETQQDENNFFHKIPFGVYIRNGL